MGIDKRIAHGVAGRHLEDALHDSVQVLGRVRTAILKRPTRPGTAKGARRELREIRRPVAQHALWWEEGENRHDGPFMAWYSARGNDEGELVLSRTRISPVAVRSQPAQMQDVGRLSLHAVARCLQRKHTLAWEELKPVISEATANFQLMAAVGLAMGLRQVAIPAGGGIFVGNFKAKGESTMATYIVFDDAAPSRWKPVTEIVRGAIKAAGVTPSMAEQAAAHGAHADWSGAIGQISASLASFRWLRQGYDPQLDPLSVAWIDFRSRRAA